MKEKLVNISFVAGGHIVQDIVLGEGCEYTADEIVDMLARGEAYTTVHEDNDLILSDGTVIGTVRYSDTELDYSDFQVEGGCYEQDPAQQPQPFNASRLAYASAVGEFVAEDEELTLGDIDHALKIAGDKLPIGLPVEQGHRDKTGRQLLREIELMQYGLMNLMTIAHNAGKLGREIK